MHEYEVKDADGNVVGPVSEDLVERAIAAGRIPSDAVYRQAGATEWLPIRGFPERASLPDVTQLIEPPSAPPSSQDAAQPDGDFTLLLNADAKPKVAKSTKPSVSTSPGGIAAADPAARYASAYSMSTSLESIGTVFRALALVTGLLAVVVGISIDYLPAKAMAFVGGVFGAIVLWGLAMLWSALGELLRALLDTAVHTRVLAERSGWTPPR